ncbi:hypothetical protein [Aequorivita marina]|uniref:hypothetical protein n=1 Tax=Aequorivita marina TaxID=3073654 RepID=UPI002873FA68|nr:hypothetical protein [Aequorivita sp. S2608]MDS1297743.1 hypothetical protein [Aequorivita sp. S2608]
MKAGRPKGSKNKATAEVREKFKELVENNLSTFQDDLDTLQPYERLTIVMQLAKFVLPTLKATELTTDSDRVIEISLKD